MRTMRREGGKENDNSIEFVNRIPESIGTGRLKVATPPEKSIRWGSDQL